MKIDPTKQGQNPLSGHKIKAKEPRKTGIVIPLIQSGTTGTILKNRTSIAAPAESGKVIRLAGLFFAKAA
ncbi:MAG: hypothetical protein A3F09_03865 [Chlamydiae bacterium RIFCSPHIGHO2_12_FULL_49_11]|nr:MAG: hypothetical protein A3F09_03865 [Chlamydiae bacterium RIFCSPHIGHO2_12_FULL_49_11]